MGSIGGSSLARRVLSLCLPDSISSLSSFPAKWQGMGVRSHSSDPQAAAAAAAADDDDAPCARVGSYSTHATGPTTDRVRQFSRFALGV